MKVCRQVLKTWLTNKNVYFLSDGEKKTVITIGKNNIDKKILRLKDSVCILKNLFTFFSSNSFIEFKAKHY